MDNKLYDLMMLLSAEPEQFQTSSDLARKLGISERTVRSRMKELSELLPQFGATVISKRHFGYQLIIDDERAFLNISRDSDVLPETVEERQQFVLKLLLESNDYVKIDDIAAELFISRNTLSNTLKRVEDILTVYHLEIDRKPNYGIKIIGNEFDKRTCFVNNLYHYYHDEEVATDLMNMLVSGNQVYKVNMSEVALEHFIQYLIISMMRIKSGYFITIEEPLAISEATQKIVANYCTEIAQQFQIIFSAAEQEYLAIHFSSKLSSDSYSKYGPNFIISSKIDELVFKMLMQVYDSFALDFRNNLELRMSLNQHLVPMDIRMRYNIPVTNPLLDIIKKEYPYPYTLATTACVSLSEYYGRSIPEDEISYIAIIFALATEKRNRQIQKKNIILVCVSGKSSSQLFKFKYKQAFGEYINDIFECTVAELEHFNFEQHKVDYIFTTVSLNRKYPVPIYEINLFIDANDILNYRQFFETGDHSEILDYYSTNLFIPKLKADTREQVISLMCQHIDRYGLLPDGFEKAVLKREELGQTDFGNLVALPHPYQVMSEQSFATVAILEKPIFWKNNMVQVVFLLSIGQKEDPNLENFYKKTSELFFDTKAIQKLIDCPKFETLVAILH